MIGWLLVLLSGLLLLAKLVFVTTNLTKQVVRTPQRFATKKPAVNLRDVRNYNNDLSNFFNINIPPLDNYIQWSGNKTTYKNHKKMLFQNSVSTISCVEPKDKLNENSSCFVKTSEGYTLKNTFYSLPFTCTTVGPCFVTAAFEISSSQSKETLPNTTFKSMLDLAGPFPDLAILNSSLSLNQTVKMEFNGPGTRRIWFRPIYWSVTGIYRTIAPFNDISFEQVFMTFDFPIMNGENVDALYALV